jgi:ankyrin repeat protein
MEVFMQDIFTLSPLMQAVTDDDLPAVQRLLASGNAVVTERNQIGVTAAHVAAG